MSVSLDEYDYGYIKMYSMSSGGAKNYVYFGPPHSMWYELVIPWVLIIGTALVANG